MSSTNCDFSRCANPNCYVHNYLQDCRGDQASVCNLTLMVLNPAAALFPSEICAKMVYPMIPDPDSRDFDKEQWKAKESNEVIFDAHQARHAILIFDGHQLYLPSTEGYRLQDVYYSYCGCSTAFRKTDKNDVPLWIPATDPAAINEFISTYRPQMISRCSWKAVLMWN